MSVAGEHRDRAVAGVADDQIGDAVAVQVGREDLRGLGTGGERGDLDETGRAEREERDALSFGVDTGEQRDRDSVETKAMSRDGSPGLTVTGGAKLPGSPGRPAR